MWKRKKKSDIYHEEVFETNSSDIIDGIDLLLNTTSYEFQNLTTLPWQDISKMQSSPSECRFEAQMLIPQKVLFADERAIIQAKINVTQGVRSPEVRVCFCSKSKESIWNLHAAKDLADKLSEICGSSAAAVRSSKTKADSSIRLIGETLVMDLESHYASKPVNVGIPATPLRILNMIATATPQPLAAPPFQLSNLRIAEVIKLTDSMVMRHLSASIREIASYSTYVPLGHQRTFVDAIGSHQASFGLGLTIKQLWVAYEYVSTGGNRDVSKTR